MSILVKITPEQIFVNNTINGQRDSYSKKYYDYFVPSNKDLLHGTSQVFDIVLLSNRKTVQSLHNITIVS